MKHFTPLLLPVLLLLLSACASQVTPQDSAAEHFQKGERYFESNLYDNAIESWEKVLDTFYSPELSMLAELKIAEAYYLSERYAEAATTYQSFLDQHPGDHRIPLILYRLGLSYYQQILGPDRDQTATENALHSFQELVRRFPETPHAREAEKLIKRCRTRLAEHEVYVGSWYLKKEFYSSAIKRLEAVLENYPDYYYQDETYYYLGKAYLESERTEQARGMFKQLFDNYPGSHFREDAEDLLADLT